MKPAAPTCTRAIDAGRPSPRAAAHESQPFVTAAHEPLEPHARRPCPRAAGRNSRYLVPVAVLCTKEKHDEKLTAALAGRARYYGSS